MTFEERGKWLKDTIGKWPDSEAIYADWKAEREKLIAEVERLQGDTKWLEKMVELDAVAYQRRHRRWLIDTARERLQAEFLTVALWKAAQDCAEKAEADLSACQEQRGELEEALKKIFSKLKAHPESFHKAVWRYEVYRIVDQAMQAREQTKEVGG